MHLTGKEFEMKPLSDSNLPGIVIRAGFFRPVLVESTGFSLLFRHSQGCSGGHSLTWDWLSDKMEAASSFTTIRNMVVFVVVSAVVVAEQDGNIAASTHVAEAKASF